MIATFPSHPRGQGTRGGDSWSVEPKAEGAEPSDQDSPVQGSVMLWP